MDIQKILGLTFEDIIATRSFDTKTGRAIQFCADCGNYPGKQYTVSKRYVDGEFAFGFAICKPCSMKVIEMASPESREHMMAFSMRMAEKVIPLITPAAPSMPEIDFSKLNLDENSSLDEALGAVIQSGMETALKAFMVDESPAESAYVPQCLWTDQPIDMTQPFTISSQVTPPGKPLETPDFYFFMTDNYLEEMASGMSTATLDEWRRYMRGIYPEISPSLMPKPVVA